MGYVATVAFFVTLALVCLDRDIKVQHDSGVYITLAKALSTGSGYREIFLQHAPPHTRYPPLFPLLLTPTVYFLGYHLVAMKLLIIALALLALIPLRAFVREADSEFMAWLVVMFTLTSHGIVFYSQSVMSEIPYLLVSLLALRQLQRLFRQADWSATTLVLAVALLWAAYLTRLIGVALLAAAVAWTLLEAAGPLLTRIRRAMIIATVGSLPAVAWALRNRWVGDISGTAYWGDYHLVVSESLVSRVAAILERIGVNLYIYARHIARVIVFYVPAVSDTLLPFLVAAVVVAGFVWCLRYRRTVLEYYVVFYACALVPFPGSRPQRYLVPLIPFIWYYFLVALTRAYLFVRDRWSRDDPREQRRWAIAAGVGVVLLLLSNASAATIENLVKRGREAYYHTVGEERYKDAALWARTHTPPESVFLWAKASLRYLWSDRRGIYPSPDQRPDELLQQARARRFDYVAIDSFSKRDRSTRLLLERHPDQFCLVYEDNVTRIYAAPHRCGDPRERRSVSPR